GDDGLLTLPMNVQVQAVGKTPTQLQAEIRKAYVPRYYVNLTVVVKAQDRYVYVDGEVKVPNHQFHIDGLTVLRAISTAGGFTDLPKNRRTEFGRFPPAGPSSSTGKEPAAIPSSICRCT